MCFQTAYNKIKCRKTGCLFRSFLCKLNKWIYRFTNVNHKYDT